VRPSVRTGRAFQGVWRQAPVAAPAWQAASRPRQSAVESRCGHGTAAGRVYTSRSSTWGVGGPQLKVREALRAPGARLLATGSRLLLQRRPHRPAKRRLAPVRPSAGGGSRAAIFAQTRAQKKSMVAAPTRSACPNVRSQTPSMRHHGRHHQASHGTSPARRAAHAALAAVPRAPAATTRRCTSHCPRAQTLHGRLPRGCRSRRGSRHGVHRALDVQGPPLPRSAAFPPPRQLGTHRAAAFCWVSSFELCGAAVGRSWRVV